MSTGKSRPVYGNRIRSWYGSEQGLVVVELLKVGLRQNGVYGRPQGIQPRRKFLHFGCEQVLRVINGAEFTAFAHQPQAFANLIPLQLKPGSTSLEVHLLLRQPLAEINRCILERHADEPFHQFGTNRWTIVVG